MRAGSCHLHAVRTTPAVLTDMSTKSLLLPPPPPWLGHVGGAGGAGTPVAAPLSWESIAGRLRADRRDRGRACRTELATVDSKHGSCSGRISCRFGKLASYHSCFGLLAECSIARQERAYNAIICL